MSHHPFVSITLWQLRRNYNGLPNRVTILISENADVSRCSIAGSASRCGAVGNEKVRTDAIQLSSGPRCQDRNPWWSRSCMKLCWSGFYSFIFLLIRPLRKGPFSLVQCICFTYPAFCPLVLRVEVLSVQAHDSRIFLSAAFSAEVDADPTSVSEIRHLSRYYLESLYQLSPVNTFHLVLFLAGITHQKSGLSVSNKNVE